MDCEASMSIPFRYSPLSSLLFVLSDEPEISRQHILSATSEMRKEGVWGTSYSARFARSFIGQRTAKASSVQLFLVDSRDGLLFEFNNTLRCKPCQKDVCFNSKLFIQHTISWSSCPILSLVREPKRFYGPFIHLVTSFLKHFMSNYSDSHG